MNAHTIRSLIDYRAAQSPDAPFILGVHIDEQANNPAGGQTNKTTGSPLSDPVAEHITYRQLLTRVSVVAEYLDQQGLAAGDSVAYAFDNSPDTAIHLLGILYGGYRAVAVNLVAGPQIMGYVLAHSDTRLVLTQPHYHDLLAAAFDHLTTDSPDCSPPHVITLTGDGLTSEDPLGTGSPCHLSPPPSVTQKTTDLSALNSDSDALLMYTSGTTGRPKGVVLSQQNLLAGGQNTATAHELTDHDRALCVLPLYHINGLCVTVMAPLVSGGSVVLPPRFSSTRFWSWCLEYQCTWFSVVPTQISYLLHGDDVLPDTHSLRFGRSASAPLSPEVHRAFEERFGLPLIETMGLTETSAQILSNPQPPGERRVGSPGIPFGDDVIICDDDGVKKPANTEGELWVRGPNVMQRYYKNKEATDAALTADGWLRTGDLGRCDSDGYIYITGRLKELIIKGGENIAPREIDDALYQHPDVIEAAAFALPCERYGQRIEAAVCVRDGSSVDESDLLYLCESVLGSFKRPDKIYFLQMLPKGPSGKIQRINLPKLTNA